MLKYTLFSSVLLHCFKMLGKYQKYYPFFNRIFGFSSDYEGI